LLVPKKHYENGAEVAQKDPQAAAKLLAKAGDLAQEKGLSGYRLTFNTGAEAGQTVFHAHLHLMGGRSFTWPPG
jgi:histidine triad (HIT) family protein